MDRDGVTELINAEHADDFPYHEIHYHGGMYDRMTIGVYGTPTEPEHESWRRQLWRHFPKETFSRIREEGQVWIHEVRSDGEIYTIRWEGNVVHLDCVGTVPGGPRWEHFRTYPRPGA